MPLFHYKEYSLTPPPDDLKPEEEVFVVPQTTECFRNYDDYISKVFTYGCQHWSCEVTGRDGLTYREALLSEQEALSPSTKSKESNKIHNAPKKSDDKGNHNALQSLPVNTSEVNALQVNESKLKGKKISPKNIPKDPTQRTLKCFVQTIGQSKHNTTTTKEIVTSSEKCPVVAQLNISLTPKRKLSELLEHSTMKSSKEGQKDNKNPIIVLNDEVKNHVKKSAPKKQKTLFQMFKAACPSNDAELTKGCHNKKHHDNITTVTDSSQRNAQLNLKENKTSKPVNKIYTELGLKKSLGIDCLVLPSPKSVNVPVELRNDYGNVLMITEFIHSFRNLLSEDKNFVFTPDQLVSGLMNTNRKNFGWILCSFLQVLLKEIRQQKRKEKIEFSELGVNLVDVPVSESNATELTRLYLKYRMNTSNSAGDTSPLCNADESLQHIVVDLNEKDVFSLRATHKLQILVHMCDEIVTSELFYVHTQNLLETKRKTRIKKSEILSDIRGLVAEQKKLEDFDDPQTEIDGFLKKSIEDDKGYVKDDGFTSKCVAQDYENKENVNFTVKDGIKSVSSFILAKRQEQAAKSKIEKEKQGEMRRVNELLYQKRRKADVYKAAIIQGEHYHRLQSLGIDRYQSRYWLLHSNPHVLYIEKLTDNHEEHGQYMLPGLPSLSTWFYYDTPQEFNHLECSLNVRNVDENNLRQKLNKMKKENWKLPDGGNNETTVSCAEDHFIDPFSCLKEELCDLICRISETGAAKLHDLGKWLEDIKVERSLDGLLPLAVAIASTINVKNLRNTLNDRDNWLKNHWIRAVREVMNISRLRFCITILDYCIMWERCPASLKCRVCRRKGGAMAVCDDCNSGYHVVCLRPSLDVTPDVTWLCPACRPERGRASRGRPVNAVIKNDEGSSEDNEDYCDVCGGDGDLVCCDNCPKVYHKECHDPPLRCIPRGLWKCCSCHGRNPTAARKRVIAVEDDDDLSDFDSSEEESGTNSENEWSGTEDAANHERDERARRRDLLKEET